MLVALVVGGTLSSCDTSAAPTAAALPSLEAGCGAKASASSMGIPFAEETSGTGELAVVGVCVDTHGPYPFLVATGAGSSVMTPALASKLHLSASKGAEVAVRGVTCVATAPQVEVQGWSMGGVELAGQRLLVASLPAGGLSPAPMGLVGSDVLSRFGAVAIDYRKSKLVIQQPEAAAPAGNVYVPAQATATLPAGLLSGTPKVSAPMAVFEGPAGTLVGVAVSLGTKTATAAKTAGAGGSGTEQLTVGSGSPTSAVSPSVATASKLERTGKTAELSGIGCKGTAAAYASGGWAVGGAALPAASLVAQDIAGSVNQGISGVIGADVLSSYGEVVVGYQTAHLWLGPG